MANAPHCTNKHKRRACTKAAVGVGVGVGVKSDRLQSSGISTRGRRNSAQRHQSASGRSFCTTNSPHLTLLLPSCKLPNVQKPIAHCPLPISHLAHLRSATCGRSSGSLDLCHLWRSRLSPQGLEVQGPIEPITDFYPLVTGEPCVLFCLGSICCRSSISFFRCRHFTAATA